MPSTNLLPKIPNIILIYVDDLGWADVGYNGNSFYETPNIDRIAREGMIFNRFYPGAANCAPSRACLMTGMYTPRHQVYVPQGLSRGGDVSNMRWKVPTQGQDSSFHTFPVSINHVAAKYVSIAEVLKEAGYVSARMGKWHIGDDNQGFDINTANGEEGNITNINGQEKRYYKDTLVAERLTDAAIQFMERHKEQPFFLYLSHWEVHGPMAARKERIEYYEEKSQHPSQNLVYAAEVEQIDQSVGRILNFLEKTKLDDNTLVIFTSDNGGVSDNTSNLPLRAGKGTYYEGGIRTAFCVRWPQVILPGIQSDIPIHGVDLLPTFAEIAKTHLPSTQPIDGVSLLPLLKGSDIDTTRAIFFHFPLYLGNGGTDRVMPVYQGEKNYWRAVPSSTIIKDHWKLIYYYEYDTYELFDLSKDISEAYDLSDRYPSQAKKLQHKLTQWVEKVNAPVPHILNELFD